MAEIFAFTKAVGKGSRAQEEDPIPLIVSSTSSRVISGKQQSSLETPDCRSAVGTDEEEGTEKEERILPMFDRGRNHEEEG